MTLNSVAGSILMGNNPCLMLRNQEKRSLRGLFMKIKLAILDRDKSYLMRVVSTFGTKYADKFEIRSFTDPDVAMATLDSAKIDVLLASDCFDIDVAKLPNRCAFAYLVDSMGIESLNDQMAICKFQRGDQFYKQIYSVYAEKASAITGYKVGDDSCNVIAFSSVSGGVGSSTMAAACAVRMAAQEKKVLYLNLEKFGCPENYFSGQGQMDMSDVIYALKNRKTNLPMKLESCVRQDPRGVYFYAGTKNALDMMELTTDEILRLLSELKLMGNYDLIVLDVDFAITKDMLKIYRQTQAIVLVGDGSQVSNDKTERAFAALSILEQKEDMPLTKRMCFVYNKVSSRNAHEINASGMKMLGGAQKYENADTNVIVGELAQKDLFDKIL